MNAVLKSATFRHSAQLGDSFAIQANISQGYILTLEDGVITVERGGRKTGVPVSDCHWFEFALVEEVRPRLAELQAVPKKMVGK